jgi:hypothetical protein
VYQLPPVLGTAAHRAQKLARRARVTHREAGRLSRLSDAERIVDFWTEAIGYQQRQESLPYVVPVPKEGHGPALVLQPIPESKSAKNRMHLDLHVDDRQAEVDRLVALGATVVDEYDETAGNGRRCAMSKATSSPYF